MSRFSPDTWLDAIQLPFAMIQFKGSVYAEPIAPDIRPAAFIILATAASIATLARMWRQDTTAPPECIQPNRRAAWALIAGTLVALMSWIMTSGNGRYGLTALTLSPMAALGALLLVTHSRRARLAVLTIIIFVQSIFLMTADPDDTWSKLTRYEWKEKNADTLPAEFIKPWRNLAKSNSVLVVTTKSLTGMSILYPVFGEGARYMNLAYLEQYSLSSPEHKRALELSNSAESIYLSRSIVADPTQRKGINFIPSPISLKENMRLKRFGLSVDDSTSCTLLPERMGAQLQICRLSKVMPENIDLVTLIPQQPLHILNALGGKCPGILDDARLPLVDDVGGILTSVHDGKYFLEITVNLDVFIRHRGETEHRLLMSGEQTKHLESYTCSDLMEVGQQYWR